MTTSASRKDRIQGARTATRCTRCKKAVRPGEGTLRRDLGGVVCQKCSRRPVRSATS